MAASCLLQLAVAIGGVVHYNKPRVRDVRDIYRERITMLKEKNQELQEALIDSRKQRIGAKQTTKQQPTPVGIS